MITAPLTSVTNFGRDIPQTFSPNMEWRHTSRSAWRRGALHLSHPSSHRTHTPYQESIPKVAGRSLGWSRHAAVDRPYMRLAIGLIDSVFLARRIAFRSCLHPMSVVLGAAERAGLRPVERQRGLLWEVTALARTRV